MCFFFYFYVVCLHVCAYAFKCKVHGGSALGLGNSGLPYYCTPPVTVPDVIGGLAVWLHNNTYPFSFGFLAVKSPTHKEALNIESSEPKFKMLATPALVERNTFSQAIMDAFVPTIFCILGYFSLKQLRGFLFFIPLPS